MIARVLGAAGECEAVELVLTGDDAVTITCGRAGRVITEHMSDIGGGPRRRLRCVCPLHGLTSAMEVN